MKKMFPGAYDGSLSFKDVTRLMQLSAFKKNVANCLQERGIYDDANSRVKMIESACFVFDASALLNIFNYSAQLQETFFELMEHVKDRVWISNHAAVEYHYILEKVLARKYEPFSTHNAIGEGISGLLTKASAASIEFLQKEFSKVLEKHEDLLRVLFNEQLAREIAVKDRIASLFEGKVGEAGDAKDLDLRVKERIAIKLAPFCVADERKENNKDGDIRVWFQTLDHLKAKKQPLIFVLDDTKENWHLPGVGPRPELLAEFREIAGAPCWFYTSEQLIEQLSTHFKKTVDATTSAELKQLQEHVAFADVGYVDHSYLDDTHAIPSQFTQWGVRPHGTLVPLGEVVFRGDNPRIPSMIKSYEANLIGLLQGLGAAIGYGVETQLCSRPQLLEYVKSELSENMYLDLVMFFSICDSGLSRQFSRYEFQTFEATYRRIQPELWRLTATRTGLI